MKKAILTLLAILFLGNIYGQILNVDRAIHTMFIKDHNNYTISPSIPISYSVTKNSEGNVQSFTYKCLMLDYLHSDNPNELTFNIRAIRDNKIRYETDGRLERWSFIADMTRCKYDGNNNLISYDEESYIKHPFTSYSYDEKGRLTQIKTIKRDMKKKGKERILLSSWIDCLVTFKYNDSDQIIKKEYTTYQESQNGQLGAVIERHVTDISINENNYLVTASINNSVKVYEFEMNENLNPNTITIKNEKNEIVKKYEFKYLDNGKMSFKREESYKDGKFEMASEESYTYELVSEVKEFYGAMDYAQRVNSVTFNQSNERVREQQNNQIRYKDDKGNWTEWMTYIGGISDTAAIDYVDRKTALKPKHNSDFYTHNLFVTDSNNFISKHLLKSNITQKREEGDRVIKRSEQKATARFPGTTKGWVYEYDIFGRLSSAANIDFNKNILEVITYGYDEFDRCIYSKRDYSESGKPTSEVFNYSYTYYKDRGHLLTNVIMNEDLHQKFEIENDSVFSINRLSGKKVKVELLNGWQNYMVYEYTEKGNLIDQRELKDGRNLYIIRCSFENKGGEELCYLRTETFFPTESTPIIERQYDRNNTLFYERIGNTQKKLVDGVLTEFSN